jgi:hypothetical protein
MFENIFIPNCIEWENRLLSLKPRPDGVSLIILQMGLVKVFYNEFWAETN